MSMTEEDIEPFVYKIVSDNRLSFHDKADSITRKWIDDYEEAITEYKKRVYATVQLLNISEDHKSMFLRELHIEPPKTQVLFTAQFVVTATARRHKDIMLSAIADTITMHEEIEFDEQNIVEKPLS